MSSKAYTREIVPNSADGVHSVSPAWVLSFVRWSNRYLNVDGADPSSGDSASFLATRNKTLVVENDCASVSVNYSKGNHTPAMQATLYNNDLNYLTAIAPGDFVFVNMLNFPEDARRVADKARSNQPINGTFDGFKGFFKIQSVRRTLAIDPGSGTKRVLTQITGHAFTEFNSVIYFNPFLLNENEANNQFLFVSRISSLWEQYVGKEGLLEVQKILTFLIDALIGFGVNKEATKKKDFELTPNTHFYIPDAVGKLLGVPEAKAAKDVYNYLFGIQKYQALSSNNVTMAQGFNPQISNVTARYYNTGIPCQGKTYVKPEYWNQVALWSILNQYTNAPINELFTTLRIAPNGSVMPTLVFRQMPFSTIKFKGLSTKFLNLPRWRISPDMLLGINIGRDEAARINFVQVFSTLSQATQGTNQGFISDQIAAGNFVADVFDIRRSGLKPYIFSSNFDQIEVNKKSSNAKNWAELMADFVIGGHLKLNGTIQSLGIVEPIAVGDNLELDGVVYHIEGVSHSCSLQPNGLKSFTTSVEMSHGVDIRSEAGPKIFPEMDNTDAQANKRADETFYDGNLPGITDEQDIVGKNGEFGTNITRQAPFPSVAGQAPPRPRNSKTISRGGKGKKK